jgi:hypothetical protein
MKVKSTCLLLLNPSALAKLS